MMATRQNRYALLLVVVLAACSGGDTVIVPKVVGMRALDAVPVLAKAGLIPEATLASEVAWIVETQSPLAGNHVRRDAAERLSLNAPLPQARRCRQSVSRPLQ